MPKNLILTRLSIAAAACLTMGLGTMASAGGVEPLETVRVASGMVRPIFATSAPEDYQRLYILEKRGEIRILDLTTNTLNVDEFLNIDPRVVGGTSNNNEQGLLGMAFHPGFRTNGYFYLYYVGSGAATRVSRFQAKMVDGIPNPDLATPSSELIMLVIAQPFSNHNGGWIGFRAGDAGNYLYIGTGDGGSGNDPGNRAQDITNMHLGKMLRIDVDGDDGPGGNYGIPPGNPFVGITGDDEIWAYGLRNPWQSRIDTLTGDIYIADVGQNAREEIDVEPGNSKGGVNYGWRCMEANRCTGLSGCTCNDDELTDPVYEYTHGSGSTQGFSVSGGAVYRGCAIPSFAGHYLFADYVLPRLWSFRWDGNAIQEFTNRYSELSPSQGGHTINQITSVVHDLRGEIYIVDQGSGTTGQIFKVVPETPTIRPEDVNCDGRVDFADILEVLGDWGDCFACPADIDGDGGARFGDILAILAEWD